MAQIRAYIAIMKHDASADGYIKPFEQYDKAVDAVHEFFESYNFTVEDGKPYDEGHASKALDPKGFECFDNVVMHNGKVAGFQHCGGNGPVAEIRKPEDEEQED